MRRGRWVAKGRTPGTMNGTEKAYASELQMRLDSCEILRFDFEPEKFRLADKTWYTPDFRLLMPDGEIHFHEVKGFVESTGRVKIKVAAEMHDMYRFFQVTKVAKKNGGGWKVEEI